MNKPVQIRNNVFLLFCLHWYNRHPFSPVLHNRFHSPELFEYLKSRAFRSRIYKLHDSFYPFAHWLSLDIQKIWACYRHMRHLLILLKKLKTHS